MVMYQIIHNLALAATLIALVAGLWQDWGVFTIVKRMLISYLGFFCLGAVMALAVKLVGALEKDHLGEPEQSNATSEEAAVK